MAETVINLVRRRGDTYPIYFGVVDTRSNPVNLQGCTFLMTADPSPAPVDNTNNIFQLTGVIESEIGGTLKFEPSESQMDNVGVFYYDVQMTDADGEITTVASGQITFGQDITKSGFTPLSLFSSGQYGFWLQPSPDTVYQDSAGTTPAAGGDPVGKIVDQSGNGLDGLQATATNRPVLTADGDNYYLSFDKVDDNLDFTLTDAINGTLVLANGEGTVAYGFSKSAGAFQFPATPAYNTDGKVYGAILRDGAMTASEKASAIAYLRSKGGGDDFGEVTDFTNYWRGWSFITEFPLIDTSSGTNFFRAWDNCFSLTSFPAGFFDNWTSTPANNCFLQAWDGCTSLTSQSVENILVSIDTSGQSAPASGFDITIDYDGSGLSAATTTAITNIKGRGWTVTINGVAQ